MHLWFARASGVTLREQLVTQVILAIVCNDLRPGQRLPSTREVARRFRIHPNTVSAGYRQLEREGWLAFRRGSGVYVREAAPAVPRSARAALDQAIAEIFQSAQRQGLPRAAIGSRLRHWLAMPAPRRFLLIEPDRELRRIVHREMEQLLKSPVESRSLSDRSLRQALADAIPVALPSRAEIVRSKLPPGSALLVLQIQSANASLSHWLPAPADALVAIASRWSEFLKRGQTMLIAAGFPPDCLILCDARKAGWRERSKAGAATVCDALTAAQLPKNARAVIFNLLSDASRQELQHYDKFVAVHAAPRHRGRKSRRV